MILSLKINYIILRICYGKGADTQSKVFSSPGIGEEVYNDGIDNDGDRLVDEDCPPPPRDCRKEIKERS
jgi:hypothetical protein